MRDNASPCSDSDSAVIIQRINCTRNKTRLVQSWCAFNQMHIINREFR